MKFKIFRTSAKSIKDNEYLKDKVYLNENHDYIIDIYTIEDLKELIKVCAESRNLPGEIILGREYNTGADGKYNYTDDYYIEIYDDYRE